jgi:lipopolysaccharide export LptBFGC system permease protein LptF
MNSKISNAIAVAILGLGICEITVIFLNPVAAIAETQQDKIQRINFARGAIQATVNGVIPPHSQHTYLVNAKAGQIMSVNVNSPNNKDHLTIYGVDGTVLTNGNMSGSSQWRGRLPITEDYIVKVTNPTNSSTKYTMTVVIP